MVVHLVRDPRTSASRPPWRTRSKTARKSPAAGAGKPSPALPRARFAKTCCTARSWRADRACFSSRSRRKLPCAPKSLNASRNMTSSEPSEKPTASPAAQSPGGGVMGVGLQSRTDAAKVGGSQCHEAMLSCGVPICIGHKSCSGVLLRPSQVHMAVSAQLLTRSQGIQKHPQRVVPCTA